LYLDFVLLLALHLNKRFFYITLVGCLFTVCASSQHLVRGTVVDSTKRYAIEAVTVQTTGSKFAMTDSLGQYKIEMTEKDSIWFSYLGKSTPKYPFSRIQDIRQFDISILLKSNVMREVRIRSRLYRQDSVQNRKDYAKVFNWKRPNVESLTSVTSTGVGFDVQELIRLFQFRKNKSMERFRERLIQQEREKFVENRFNKALVRQLTGLEGEELDRFITQAKPSYAFTLYATEYDFRMYIKKAGERFKADKSF
jgi:hypothetical protein